MDAVQAVLTYFESKTLYFQHSECNLAQRKGIEIMYMLANVHSSLSICHMLQILLFYECSVKAISIVWLFEIVTIMTFLILQYICLASSN